jgi:hypothetical protein
MVTMNDTMRELRALTETYHKRFLDADDNALSAKPRAEKWSRKEVIGHLIDSAHNNLRRFICGQYDESANPIVYDPDFWVKANNYQNLSTTAVIDLWRAVNDQLYNVLLAMPEEAYTRTCNTGRQEMEMHDLEWLAADYVKHMKHHLNQIFPGEFDVTYISK